MTKGRTVSDDKTKAIKITGRPRYADAGTKTKITVRNRQRDTLFKIKGGYIESRGREGGEFLIAAKHENGTDFEHDSAYVVYLEGAGLMFDGMMGTTLHFTGVLLKGSWYDPDVTLEAGVKTPHSSDTDEISVCEDTEYYHKDDSEWPAGHLIMPFTPPKRQIRAQQIEIVVTIGEDE